MFSKALFPSLIAVLALCCFVDNPTQAQVTSEEVVPNREQEPSIILQKMVSIDFPGGTVAEFIELLQEKVDFNCIIQADIKDYPLPKIRLKDVYASSALDAIGFATNFAISPNHEDLAFVRIEYGNYDPPQTLVFNLKGKRTPAEGLSETPGVEGSPETAAEILVEAIKAGLEFQGGNTNPVETKYHQASGLFFAKGTPHQLEMVTQIVNQFTQNNLK
jgi:hypothetical protein